MTTRGVFVRLLATGAFVLAAPAQPSAVAARTPEAPPRAVRPAAGSSGGADPARQRRERGIAPPWREHAIPEMRRQPGKKPRHAVAGLEVPAVQQSPIA